jgi:F0F1-type ATP synthase membrane subunit c/vacuolar-type H+-ATPase subunit K
MNQDRVSMGQALLLAVIVEFYAILGFAFAALMLFR